MVPMIILCRSNPMRCSSPGHLWAFSVPASVLQSVGYARQEGIHGIPLIDTDIRLFAADPPKVSTDASTFRCANMIRRISQLTICRFSEKVCVPKSNGRMN